MSHSRENNAYTLSMPGKALLDYGDVTAMGRKWLHDSDILNQPMRPKRGGRWSPCLLRP